MPDHSERLERKPEQAADRRQEKAGDPKAMPPSGSSRGVETTSADSNAQAMTLHSLPLREYLPWLNRGPISWVIDFPSEVLKAARAVLGNPPTYTPAEIRSRVSVIWGLDDKQLQEKIEPEFYKCMLKQYERRANKPEAYVEDLNFQLDRYYRQKGDEFGIGGEINVREDTINIRFGCCPNNFDSYSREGAKIAAQKMLLTTLAVIEEIAKHRDSPTTFRVAPFFTGPRRNMPGSYVTALDLMRYQFGFKGLPYIIVKTTPPTADPNPSS